MLLGISLSFKSYAQQMAIFGKNEICYLNSKSISCEPKENNKVEFLNDYKNFISNRVPYETSIDLVTPPLEWGKMVNNKTSGKIMYHDFFKNGFVFKIKIDSLLPNHKYLFTINGNPKLMGNNLLPDTVPNNNTEKYYDFLFIKTDAKGKYASECAVFLTPGTYDVRFYIKDTDDFKIVLFRDFFRFDVK